MEFIKLGKIGAISPLSQTFPTDCVVIDETKMSVPPNATAFGYVLSGTVKTGHHQYEEGEYFTTPTSEVINAAKGRAAVFVRHGYRGQTTFGGVVETTGRGLPGSQGIRRTHLIARHTPNDPAFLSLHLPRSCKTETIHPRVPLFCVLCEGSAKVVTQLASQTLAAGEVFVVDTSESYWLQIGDKPAVLLVFEALDSGISQLGAG